jgi:hypothetical protein
MIVLTEARNLKPGDQLTGYGDNPIATVEHLSAVAKVRVTFDSGTVNTMDAGTRVFITYRKANHATT